MLCVLSKYKYSQYPEWRKENKHSCHLVSPHRTLLLFSSTLSVFFNPNRPDLNLTNFVIMRLLGVGTALSFRSLSWSSTRHAHTRSAVTTAAEHIVNEFFTDKKVLTITGAGLSTASNIPDYRSPNGAYSRGHKPIIHDEFMNNELKRKRYWGRSLVGYRQFSEAQPNEGHFALANLEKRGVIGVKENNLAVITQNVDRLHAKAGSKGVVELHGRGDVLVCMSCREKTKRGDFHRKLMSLNSLCLEKVGDRDRGSELKPDGDADIDALVDGDYSGIVVPGCESCR